MNPIQLISASAGSGKTTRLTRELTTLLQSYHPSQIIATTFTRAAAGELKSRVREEVIKTGNFYLGSIIDEALISTVNGIGGQLLELFAFEKGISPVLNVIEDEEKAVIFQMAVSNILSHPTLPDMTDIEDRLSLKKDDLRKQVESILDLARANGVSATELPAFRKLSLEALKEKLPGRTEDLRSLMHQLTVDIPRLQPLAESLGDETTASATFIKEAQHFLYELHNKEVVPWSLWSSLYNKKGSAKLEGEELVQSMKEALRRHLLTEVFQDDLFSYIGYCFSVCEQAMIEYEQIKAERGLIDFVDQEASLLELLDQPAVQQRFSSRFKVLLVDEFQDTSPLQLALFLKMAALVEKVIWVGDPKQSIYGFRNSDSELINKVIKAINNQNPDDILKDSWRSRPQLVQTVNQLFLAPFQQDGTLSEEQIVLHPKRKEPHGLQPALQLWGFQWQSPGNNERDTNDKYLSQVASRLKAFKEEKPQIQDPHTGELRPVKWGDIAILCRTNNKCRSVANALRRQGIQAVVADTGLQYTAEWRLLKACLHLLLDARDSLAKAEITFLTSRDHDMGGIIDDRLEFLHAHGVQSDNWLDDDPRIRWIHDHREQLTHQPLTVAIPLIYAGLSFHSLVGVWGDEAQRRNNLDQILLYASRYEDHCFKFSLLPNAHGFLYWFQQLAENDKDERGVTANEQAVNLLTYHKAKGLEWPVVLLLDLDKEFEPDIFCARIEADGLVFEDPLNARSLKYFVWPYGQYFGKNRAFKPFSELFEEAEELKVERKKEREENLRLLYVGFTRARDYLILGFQPSKMTKKVRSSNISWLEQMLEDGQKPFFDEVTFAAGCVEKNDLVDDLIEGVRVRKWVSIYSGEAAASNGSHGSVTVYQEACPAERKPYLVNPSGVEASGEEYTCELLSIVPEVRFVKTSPENDTLFGSCIHHILCAWQPGCPEEEGLQLIRSLLLDYGCLEAVKAKELYSNICAFYRWIEEELKPLRIRKEVPVMMERDGQLVKGMIDMVVEGETMVYIIDYKTFNPIETEEATSCFEKKALSFSGQLGYYKEILAEYYEGKEVQAGIHFVFINCLYWLKPLYKEDDRNMAVL